MEPAPVASALAKRVNPKLFGSWAGVRLAVAPRSIIDVLIPVVPHAMLVAPVRSEAIVSYRRVKSGELEYPLVMLKRNTNNIGIIIVFAPCAVTSVTGDVFIPSN